MKSTRQKLQQRPANKTLQNIKRISVFIFVVKLFIIWRITNLPISQVQGHIWLGADGENYLKGVDGLVTEGFFSKADILNYWPAGYPLIIYVFSFIGKSYSLTTLSVIQTLIFSVSVFFLASELYKSSLRKFTLIIYLIITFNPTLSLNSMSLGYESFAASGFVFVIAKIMQELRVKTKKQTLKTVISISITLGIMSFIQPRFLLTSALIIILWVILRFKFNFLNISRLLVTSFVIISLAPISLVVRNHFATQNNVISTNLGVTMNIGAGKTSGGYVKNPPGVPCKISLNASKSKSDAELIRCVLDWYVSNPSESLKLFYNKSIYFWSPWFGPEANGTMARNPWLTIHPFKNMTKTQDGINLLYGTLGKIISWIWLLSGIFLVFYGFLILWRQKFEVRLIAAVAGVIVISSWLVTLISIGDHRFRLPIMGASLFLQAVGIRTLFAGGKPPMVEPTSLR